MTLLAGGGGWLIRPVLMTEGTSHAAENRIAKLEFAQEQHLRDRERFEGDVRGKLENIAREQAALNRSQGDVALAVARIEERLPKQRFR